MTTKQEILETQCDFAGMVYSKYQVDNYGINPTPPFYDEARVEDLSLKRDVISNKVIKYLPIPAFIYEQETQEDIWEIEHNLDYNPRVFIFDNDDKEIDASIIFYVDTNNLTLTFTLPMCGKAYLY